MSAIQLGLGPNPGAISIAAVTDASGTVQASYINCPTGNNISQSGTAPNPIHTQSSYYDSTTGTQLYFGNGVYDSTISRWNQRANALRSPYPYNLTFGPEQGTLAADATSLGFSVAAFAISVAAVPVSGPLAPVAAAAVVLSSLDVLYNVYQVTSDVNGSPFSPPILVSDAYSASAAATGLTLAITALPAAGPLAPLDAAAVVHSGASLLYSAGKLAHDVAVATGT